jgi:hypothetical protein
MEQPPASRLRTTVPLGVILVIVEYSTLQGVLPLTRTCSKLRHLCASIYLKQIGILISGPTITKIRLVGGPFSALTVSLLQCLTPIRSSQRDSPRMSLVVDFYHITSFLCHTKRLLRSSVITSVELVVLDDELSLLDCYNLSGSLLSALSHLPQHCKRLRFKAGPEHLSRSLLYQHWIPVSTPKHGRLSIWRALAALTEVHLSLPLFYRCSLKNSISFLLHHPKLTSLSLTCSTAAESEDVLLNACLPALENSALAPQLPWRASQFMVFDESRYFWIISLSWLPYAFLSLYQGLITKKSLALYLLMGSPLPRFAGAHDYCGVNFCWFKLLSIGYWGGFPTPHFVS